MTQKTKEAPKTEAVTNMEYVDNTDVVVVETATVETEEVEILNGLTQVNYR